MKRCCACLLLVILSRAIVILSAATVILSAAKDPALAERPIFDLPSVVVAFYGREVKISYYRYESVGGEVSLLAFIANTCKEEVRDISFTLQGDAPMKCTDAFTGKDTGVFPLKPYEYRILFLR